MRGSNVVDLLSIVLLLPPAPAARVLEGLAFATLSALSAAAFRLIAVAGPPGGFGDEGRAVEEPVDGGELTGEDGRGEDCDDVLAAGNLHCMAEPSSSDIAAFIVLSVLTILKGCKPVAQIGGR